jgi:anti-sigma factor RsiW
MRCSDEVRLRIGALLDDELSSRERDELAAHIAECADCARYRNELRGVGAHVRELREPAPASLALRLRARLEVEAAEAPLPRARPGLMAMVRNALGGYLQFYYRPALAMLAVAIISAAAAFWWAGHAQDQQALAHDVLAAHVRSLLQDNTVQVASLDTHTVKPWFAGRLDYTPVVKDLSEEGFKLIGGRLDYVDGRRVAALVYMRRLHKINVFIWPARDATATASHLHIDGYNIVSWTAANMTFWAISDLEDRELSELAGLI